MKNYQTGGTVLERGVWNAKTLTGSGMDDFNETESESSAFNETAFDEEKYNEFMAGEKTSGDYINGEPGECGEKAAANPLYGGYRRVIGYCESCGSPVFINDGALVINANDELIHTACWDYYASDNMELFTRVVDDGDE